jgi:hypothetical protein
VSTLSTHDLACVEVEIDAECQSENVEMGWNWTVSRAVVSVRSPEHTQEVVQVLTESTGVMLSKAMRDFKKERETYGRVSHSSQRYCEKGVVHQNA